LIDIDGRQIFNDATLALRLQCVDNLYNIDGRDRAVAIDVTRLEFNADIAGKQIAILEALQP
jgi:hypothetical protein